MVEKDQLPHKNKGNRKASSGPSYQGHLATRFTVEMLVRNEISFVINNADGYNTDDVVIGFKNGDQELYNVKEIGDKPTGHFSDDMIIGVVSDFYRDALPELSIKKRFILVTRHTPKPLKEILESAQKSKPKNFRSRKEYMRHRLESGANINLYEKIVEKLYEIKTATNPVTDPTNLNSVPESFHDEACKFLRQIDILPFGSEDWETEARELLKEKKIDEKIYAEIHTNLLDKWSGEEVTREFIEGELNIGAGFLDQLKDPGTDYWKKIKLIHSYWSKTVELTEEEKKDLFELLVNDLRLAWHFFRNARDSKLFTEVHKSVVMPIIRNPIQTKTKLQILRFIEDAYKDIPIENISEIILEMQKSLSDVQLIETFINTVTRIFTKVGSSLQTTVQALVDKYIDHPNPFVRLALTKMIIQLGDLNEETFFKNISKLRGEKADEEKVSRGSQILSLTFQTKDIERSIRSEVIDYLIDKLKCNPSSKIQTFAKEIYEELEDEFDFTDEHIELGKLLGIQQRNFVVGTDWEDLELPDLSNMTLEEINKELKEEKYRSFEKDTILSTLTVDDSEKAFELLKSGTLEQDLFNRLFFLLSDKFSNSVDELIALSSFASNENQLIEVLRRLQSILIRYNEGELTENQLNFIQSFIEKIIKDHPVEITAEDTEQYFHNALTSNAGLAFTCLALLKSKFHRDSKIFAEKLKGFILSDKSGEVIIGINTLTILGVNLKENLDLLTTNKIDEFQTKPHTEKTALHLIFLRFLARLSPENFLKFLPKIQELIRDKSSELIQKNLGELLGYRLIESDFESNELKDLCDKIAKSQVGDIKCRSSLAFVLESNIQRLIEENIEYAFDIIKHLFSSEKEWQVIERLAFMFQRPELKVENLEYLFEVSIIKTLIKTQKHHTSAQHHLVSFLLKCIKKRVSPLIIEIIDLMLTEDCPILDESLLVKKLKEILEIYLPVFDNLEEPTKEKIKRLVNEGVKAGWAEFYEIAEMYDSKIEK